MLSAQCSLLNLRSLCGQQRPFVRRTAAAQPWPMVVVAVVHSAPPWDDAWHGDGAMATGLLCSAVPTPQGACPRPLVSGGLTDERCSVRIQSCRRASVQQLDGPLERACAALYQVSGPFLVLQAGQGLRARAIGRQSPAALPLPSLWRRTPRRTTLASLQTRTAEPGGPRLLQPGRALLRLRAAGCGRQKVTRSLSPNCAPASHQPG